MFVCLNKIYSYYSNINPATSAIVRCGKRNETNSKRNCQR